MSRRGLVLAIIAATTVITAFALWLTVSAPVNEQRQQARDFFGGDPERSVRGGQEMKPRWN